MDSMDSYRLFMKIKRLPSYRISGEKAYIPDEYAHLLGVDPDGNDYVPYEPQSFLFDYQRDISQMFADHRKFCGFIDCGYGKTLIMFEHARHAIRNMRRGQCHLIVSPLMVVPQTVDEYRRFYGTYEPIVQLRSGQLQDWLLHGKERLGITNYEAIMDVRNRGRLAGMSIDESSMLKSHYGKWGQMCLDIGAGLEWKGAFSGTPAPNDRVEYANHAVFMDQCRTVNEFLARYFVNRGETDNRWEMMPHAVRPFYRNLSHWSIFMSNPATYGWKDNCGTIPPIRTHLVEVDMTEQQVRAVRSETGSLVASSSGGIGTRGRLAKIGKGWYGGGRIESNKPHVIHDLATSGDCSSIIWCKYNPEQDAVAALFDGCASIDGSTPYEKRIELVNDFKAGRRRQLVSKPKVLGFGLNLQIARRHVFSTLQDSYEEFYQCIKRSNRVGSTEPLDVYVPATEVEMPMVENVFRKAKRIDEDTAEQEAMFRECILK